MSSLQQRAQEVTAQLTPREVAILRIRRWLAGEEADWRLINGLDQASRKESDRLLQRVEDANREVFSLLAYYQHFVVELEMLVAWAGTLQAYEQRCATLTSRLRAEGVRVRETAPKRPAKNVLVLEPLPLVRSGLSSDMKPLFGGWAEPDYNANPPRLDDLVRVLLGEAARALEWRWSEVAALSAVLLELGELEYDGEPITHPDNAAAIQDLQRVLHRVRSDLAAVGHHVALGAPGAEHLGWVRERLGLPANVEN